MLIDLLPTLPHLTYLELGRTRYDDMQPLETLPPSGLSGISGCSSLQHLELSYVWMQASEMWQHLFPPGKQLPVLHSLMLHAMKPQMTRPDLESCVQCCPNLQELGLCSATMADNVQLEPLLQLTGPADRIEEVAQQP